MQKEKTVSVKVYGVQPESAYSSGQIFRILLQVSLFNRRLCLWMKSTLSE